MGKLIDLTGQKFGRLTVVARIGTKNGSALWKCVCDCGNTAAVTSRSLKTGNTSSCGCMHSEQLAARNRKTATHHSSKSRLYGVWHSMKRRCYSPSCKDYPRYGGRGITICNEWVNDFAAFKDWAMSNGYDPNADYMQCTIDRIDNNKGYTPDNCRWVAMSTQATNRRKENVKRDELGRYVHAKV